MTLELLGAVFGYATAFLLGLGSGIAVETLRFKYLRLKDNWNDLKGPLQEIYVAVRNLQNDCDHVIRIRKTSSNVAVGNVIRQINQNLETYSEWFKPFEGDLGIKKLDSIDEELGAALMGISYFALYSETDSAYVETRLASFREMTDMAEKRLGEFMKAKIPHYVIFGRRRLANWRDSRF